MAQRTKYPVSLFIVGWILACQAYPVRKNLASLFKQPNGRNSLMGILPSENALWLLRGGSTVEAADDDEENKKETEQDDDEGDEEESPQPATSSMSTAPVKLLIQTNWGSSVIDHKIELMAARTRNVESLKKSLSRLLPGKPPLLSLDLVFEGRILEDEMLVDELFDDDEEDEDEDSDESSKVLILNTVPPVDPKFATELAPKLKPHMDDDDDTLSTEEVLDAYFLNQAAMARNAQQLSETSLSPSPLLRLEVQEQAKQLLENLKSQIPDDVWEASLEPVRISHNTEERRGQRYRSGKGGARTNLKKSIQTNMNIHWGETIRNCLLFLFFGYFGGRNSFSRTLMLWGAPLCFIVQARPVKIWSKILFYMMVNPPGIVLSLLPAPQQAILSMDMEKSYSALYGNTGSGETEKSNSILMEDLSDDEGDDESDHSADESEIDE